MLVVPVDDLSFLLRPKTFPKMSNMANVAVDADFVLKRTDAYPLTMIGVAVLLLLFAVWEWELTDSVRLSFS